MLQRIRQTPIRTGLFVAVVVLLGPALSAAADESSAGATFMGVRLEEEVDHSEGGARVTRVVRDSPADKAGLEQGDIVVRFDKHVIRGPVALTQRIHSHEPGDVVRVVVIRDGTSRLTLELELGKRRGNAQFFGLPIDPDDEAVRAYSGWDAEQWGEWQEKFTEQMEQLGERQRYVFAPRIRGQLGYGLLGGRPKLGVQLVETTAELRVHLGSDEFLGVLVSKVLRATPAEHAGIEVGDLIVGVGDEEIADSDDLIRALEARTGETFDVELIRDGKRRTIPVTIPALDTDTPTGPRA